MKHRALTTAEAIAAIAWERAPRYGKRSVNYRVVCADGYKVSVQASPMHYANDDSPTAPYWREEGATIAYPFRTFEVGATDSDPEPAEVWDEYDSGGVWAWVPRAVVADLLELHGGAVRWDVPR